MSATDFWQEHQVGGPYEGPYESEQALAQRAAMFPGLEKLMPTRYPGKTVLDFGCGPGHDTILFLRNGASHVYYADVSWQALKTTSERLVFHGLSETTALFADDDPLPSVEHVHCAGVLHHMHDPLAALMRLRCCLMPDGHACVMVYDGEMSQHTQSSVPITEWWTHSEFLALAQEAGWRGKYTGSYECSADWRPECWAACYRLWVKL